MKTNFIGLLLVGLLATSSAFDCSVRADDSSALLANARKAFEQLTDSSVKSLNEAAKQALVKGGAVDSKFRIVGVANPVTTTAQTTTTTTTTTTPTATASQTTTTTSTPTATTSQTTTTSATTTIQTTSTVQTAVKVWFELPNGTYVNPAKKKWNAKEQFYIHVEAAVPVYVALFQNYSESRPTSRQIYPDKNYPDSFKALQPGKENKLPVLFEMDDDTRDEIISMVVVRADWSGIQNGLTSQATASVSTNNGAAQVTAQVTSSGAGTLKCINERMATNKELTADSAKALVENLNDANAAALCKTVNDATAFAKFKIVEATKTTGKTPEDVCSYMFGAGYVAQWQLTISK